MSKKKASGNTMTLKDFHGGSIPTDLPLPSAPGVVPRSTDRPGYDKASWGTPMGRSDQRTRPNSSPSIRQFDDKTPFLTHTAHIGRNFDEDERTPLDGLSAPRKTVSDDSFRVPSTRVEVKSASVSTGRVAGWQGLGGFHPGNGNDTAHSGANSQMVVGNSENSVTGAGAYPSAWAVRKEVTAGANEPVQSACAAQIAVSKLVHASAVEKVYSGRWQSRVSLPSQAEVEVIKHSEAKGYDDMSNRVDEAWGGESSDAILARRVEKGLSIEEGTHGGRKTSPDYEKTRGPTYLEVKEGKVATDTDMFQTTRSDGKRAEPKILPTVPSEVSERPKLKLLPRTKPLENVEKPVTDPKQEQMSGIPGTGHFETVNMMHGNAIPSKPGLTSNKSGNQPPERPKLNLKPRSQTFEQLEGNPERERVTVFGGARPRELVLKERGIDDTNHLELVQHSDRAPEQSIPSRQGERPENLPHDMRTTGKLEKEFDRTQIQRRNWRNDENKRNNNRENERQHQLITQERHPSPETWRKPVEPPKPTTPDGSGMRYGKAASALELAQAFSRPFSDPKVDDRFDVQKGLPGRSQVPFSRLMSPTPRKINGY